MRGVIGLTLTALPCVAGAAIYPSRLVTLVVPFPAGSATDGVTRKIAEGLSAAFHQTFIVENKPGGDGIIAARSVARAEPDGHTIFVTTNTTHSANPNIYTSLPYDPEKDFAPIGGIMKIPMVLAVRANFPADDLASFVKMAKKKQMSFGSGNTSSRGAAELLKARIGADMLHVPYRGTPQAITDLMGGNIDFMFPDPSSALGPIRGGQIKLLAVASSTRLNQFPNVPTIAESGYPGFEMVAWVGAFAPAKTPPEIITRLNDEMNKILKSRDMIDYFDMIGAQVYTTTPQELHDYEVEDTKRWAEIVDLAKIERKQSQ
ncbi:tripartite tricarboxylate transporter substrate binding protein [Microbacteriaceae bacterium K1510]|nr:tripartite tricarboxylate transporter substrate binding protein [Microbacteriaceae bacterium K1510]